MRPRRLHVALTALAAALWIVVVGEGCSAVGRRQTAAGTGGSTSTVTMSVTTAAGTGGAGHLTSSSAGGGGGITFDDAGVAADAADELTLSPCGSKCGTTELCDPAHLGLDNNCDGQVGEGCSCTPGSVHWCFAGDPAYHNAPGCFDGTMRCNELGGWGPCLGGVQAIPPDDCFENDTAGCHAITAVPGAVVDLRSGTGQFSMNAAPGSETYAVACPMGASQCPAVTPPGSFSDVESGEYTVTYTKLAPGASQPTACTFPLFIGARGLRVELTWEHNFADMGVDLDLHVHQPESTLPWAVSPGQPQDCTWSSCKFDQISMMDPAVPHWYSDSATQPSPCNWDVETSLQSPDNSCYNDARGVGAQWASLHKGCHNPRSDIDVVQCVLSVTDPADPRWCGPENVNVDYPPQGRWFRVGVHYYFNHGRTYDVHPEIKIYCDGALSADLGPQGYNVPEAPVTFRPQDGAGQGNGNRFWSVADVAFTTDACGHVSCVVQPIYESATAKTPSFELDSQATTAFSPPWPPPPQ